MSDKISDALSVRANVSEATIWLAIIASWLSPYEWYVDLFITVVVGAINWSVVTDHHHRANEQ